MRHLNVRVHLPRWKRAEKKIGARTLIYSLSLSLFLIGGLFRADDE